MRIRPATRDDNEALCALERRTPLEMGASSLVLDRTNFFALHDLQARTQVMLAEDEYGAVIGVCAGALNEVTLAGKRRLLLYIHHERIAPEHQRRGVGGALVRALGEHWKDAAAEPVESTYWFIAPENSKSRAYAERGTRPWPVSAYTCSLQASAEDRPPPKQIGAGPIFDIVRLINRTHEGEELFAPYEQVDFGQRLSRSAEYGWGDIYGRFVDGALVAVAGVWDKGRCLLARNGPDDAGKRSWSVADYGFEDGAEVEMAALLRDLCARAAAAGRDAVAITLSPTACLYREIAGLPHELSENLLYTPRIEAPADPAPVYLDPLYY